MKKVISLSLAAVVACSAFAFVGCGGDRANQLKLFIPGEYLDYDLLDEFETWYQEQTGNTVEVVTPNTFDVVEDIINRVKNKADFDLLCPSDYAVEQLMRMDLLQKVDKDIIDVEPLLMEQYADIAKIIDPQLEYSVPYMYGTFGLMYDYSKTQKHIDSWSALFTDEFAGKSSNKSSLREAMTSAAIWANRDELSTLSNGFTDYGDAYKTKLQSIYEDTSSAAISACVSTLESMKNFATVWGEESLKFDMASGKTNVQVALMWSCDAGYVMNDYEDDDGVQHTGQRNMWYTVPKEGGNLYIDSFVISKYAENVEAANYFLKFLCLKETALANSEYAGAVSPIRSAYTELYDQYTNDPSYAEESGQEWRDMYIDMLFPSDATLARCGVMRDYKGANDAFVNAWAEVRME